jgi:hypothetical protein
LTHAAGNWADQYLPESDRRRSPLRERINIRFFSNETDAENRHRIIEENHIDYILTRRPYDFELFTDCVLDGPSCFLYQVRR